MPLSHCKEEDRDIDLRGIGLTRHGFKILPEEMRLPDGDSLKWTLPYCEPEDSDTNWRDESETNKEFTRMGLNPSDLAIIPWMMKMPEGGYRKVRWIIQCCDPEGNNAKYQVEFAAYAAFNPKNGSLRHVLERSANEKEIVVYTLPTADSGVRSGRSEDFDPQGFNSYFDRHNIGQDQSRCYISMSNVHTGLTEPFGLSIPEFTKHGWKVQRAFFDPLQNSQENRTHLVKESLINAFDEHMKYLQGDSKKKHTFKQIGSQMHIGAFAGGVRTESINAIHTLDRKARYTLPKRQFDVKNVQSKIYVIFSLDIERFKILADAERAVKPGVTGQFWEDYVPLGAPITRESRKIRISRSGNDNADGDYDIFEAASYIKRSQSNEPYVLWIYKFKHQLGTPFKHWILTPMSSKTNYITKTAKDLDEKKDLNILLVSNPFNERDISAIYNCLESSSWHKKMKSNKYSADYNLFREIPIQNGYSWMPSTAVLSDVALLAVEPTVPSAAVPPPAAPTDPNVTVAPARRAWNVKSETDKIISKIGKLIKAGNSTVFQSPEHNKILSSLIRDFQEKTRTWFNVEENVSFESSGNLVIVKGLSYLPVPDAIIGASNTFAYSILDEFSDKDFHYQAGFTLEHKTPLDYYLGSIWVCIFIQSVFGQSRFLNSGYQDGDNRITYIYWFISKFRTFDILKSYIVDWFDHETVVKTLNPIHMKYAKELQDSLRENSSNVKVDDMHKYLIATALNLEVREYSNLNGFELNEDSTALRLKQEMVAEPQLVWGIRQYKYPSTYESREFDEVFAVKMLSWSGQQDNFGNLKVRVKCPKTNPVINFRILEIGTKNITKLDAILSKYIHLNFTSHKSALNTLSSAIEDLNEKNQPLFSSGQTLMGWNAHRKLLLIYSIVSFHAGSIMTMLNEENLYEEMALEEPWMKKQGYSPVFFQRMELWEKWKIFLKLEHKLNAISPGEFQTMADVFGVRITVFDEKAESNFLLPVVEVSHGFFNVREGGSNFIMWNFSPRVDSDTEKLLSDIVLLKSGKSYSILTNDITKAEDVKSTYGIKSTPFDFGRVREHRTKVGFFDSIGQNSENSSWLKDYTTRFFFDDRNIDIVAKKIQIVVPREMRVSGTAIIRDYRRQKILNLYDTITSDDKWTPTEDQGIGILDILCENEHFGFVVILSHKYTTSSTTFSDAMELDVYFTEDSRGGINFQKKCVFGDTRQPNGIFLLYSEGNFKLIDVKSDQYMEMFYHFGIVKRPDSERRLRTSSQFSESMPKKDRSISYSRANLNLRSNCYLGYGEENLATLMTCSPIRVNILKIDKFRALPEINITDNTRTEFEKLYRKDKSFDAYRPLVYTIAFPSDIKHAELSPNNFKLMYGDGVDHDVEQEKIKTYDATWNEDKSVYTKREEERRVTTGVYSMCSIENVFETGLPKQSSLIRCVREWMRHFSQKDLTRNYTSPNQRAAIEKYSSDVTYDDVSRSGKVTFHGILNPDKINVKTLCKLIDFYTEIRSIAPVLGENIISKTVLTLMKKARLRWPALCNRTTWESIEDEDDIDYTRSNGVRFDDVVSDVVLIGAIFNVKFNKVFPFSAVDINSLFEDRKTFPFVPMWRDRKFRWPLSPINHKDIFDLKGDELEPFQIPILSVSDYFYPLIIVTGSSSLYDWKFYDPQKPSTRDAARKRKEAREQAKEQAANGAKTNNREKVDIDSDSDDDTSLIPGLGPGSGSGGMKTKGGGGGGADYSGQYSDGSGGGGAGGVLNSACPNYQAWLDSGGTGDYPGPGNWGDGGGGRRGRYHNPDDENPDKRGRGGRGNGRSGRGGGSGGFGGHGNVTNNGDGSFTVGPGGYIPKAVREAQEQRNEADRADEEEYKARTGLGSKFNLGLDARDINHKQREIHNPYDISELHLSSSSKTKTYAEGRTKELYMLTAAMGSAMMTINKLKDGGWTTMKIHIGQTEEARKLATMLTPYFKKVFIYPISKGYTSHILLAADGFKKHEAKKSHLEKILSSCAGLNTAMLNRACEHIRDLEIITKDDFDKNEYKIEAASQKLFRDWLVQSVNTNKAYIQATFQGHVMGTTGFLTQAVANYLNKAVFDKVPESMREQNKQTLIFMSSTPYGQQIRPLFDILFVPPKSGLGTGFQLRDLNDEEDDYHY